MELIKWSDQYATGIAGIDSEHRELIDAINAFYGNLTERSDRDKLINALNDIYATIHAHFMLEERLMVKNSYGDYEEHRDDHARLLDDIRDISMGLENSSGFDEQQLRIKLSDWFLVHFKTHDSRLHKLEQLMAGHAESNGGWLKSLKAMLPGKK